MRLSLLATWRRDNRRRNLIRVQEVLNRLFARFVNWELLLIHRKPTLIPQLERTVGIVETLIDERFIPIRRVLAVHSNEAQDTWPATGMCTLVSGYAGIQCRGFRGVQAPAGLNRIHSCVIDRYVISNSQAGVRNAVDR